MRWKRRRGSRLIAAALTVFLLGALAPRAALAQKARESTQEKELPYFSSILIEAGTGKVLKEHNADKRHIPASIVKMMVMLLVAEAVDKKVLSWDQKITVSAAASKMGGSQVFLRQGEQFTLRQLFKTVAIASANDAAYAISETLAGVPEAMVEMMNRRAKELGMDNTLYHSVHGLPPGPGQDEDYTTAHDTAILARQIVHHPAILEFTHRWKDTFRNGSFVLYNTNRHLLRTFNGMDGIKTGYYKEAGYNLCASAKRGGMRLISVVLGAVSRKERDRQTSRLLLEGFRRFKKLEVVKKEQVINKPVPVVGGKKKVVKIMAADAISAIVQRIDETHVKTRLDVPSPLQAPVTKGQKVGEITAVLGDKVLGKAPLLALDTVPKLTWWDRIKFW